MAVKVEIVVTIDDEGNIHLKTHGIKGDKCIKELKSFEKGLGKMEDVQKSSEYYEKQKQRSTVKTKK